MASKEELFRNFMAAAKGYQKAKEEHDKAHSMTYVSREQLDQHLIALGDAGLRLIGTALRYARVCQPMSERLAEINYAAAAWDIDSAHLRELIEEYNEQLKYEGLVLINPNPDTPEWTVGPLDYTVKEGE